MESLYCYSILTFIKSKFRKNMTVQNGADKPEGVQGIPNYFNLFRPLKMRLLGQL